MFGGYISGGYSYVVPRDHLPYVHSGLIAGAILFTLSLAAYLVFRRISAY